MRLQNAIYKQKDNKHKHAKRYVGLASYALMYEPVIVASQSTHGHARRRRYRHNILFSEFIIEKTIGGKDMRISSNISIANY